MRYLTLVNLLGMVARGNKLFDVFDILPNFSAFWEQEFRSWLLNCNLKDIFIWIKIRLINCVILRRFIEYKMNLRKKS